MNNTIKQILRRPYRLVKILYKVKWIKTLRINFALLPFSQALKLPIVVTGKLIIDSLKGRAEITVPLKFGMINLGKDMDNMPIGNCAGRLLIDGHIIFNGHCVISQSVNLCVWSKSKMKLGHCTVICTGTSLKSTYTSIEIGDYTRLTSGCFVIDTNVHCIRDVETGRIAKPFAPIVIGSRCWLTMNTSVMPGTVLPDYCITTRGSLLNKDYNKICGPGTLLGGAPAKVLKTGIRRLFDFGIENKVNAYFLANPDAVYYQDTPGFLEENEEKVIEQFII